MKRNRSSVWTWLMVIVLAHLGVSMVHGVAHTQAHVPLSLAANLFVYIVILAGPLIGLALTWRTPRLGGWVIGLAMAGSLVFGLVNHFVLSSPDHITHVDPQWRTLFAATALLLTVSEGLGALLAAKFLDSERVGTNSTR